MRKDQEKAEEFNRLANQAKLNYIANKNSIPGIIKYPWNQERIDELKSKLT